MNAPDGATRADIPVAATSSGSSNMTYTSTPPRTYQYPSSSPPRDLNSGRSPRRGPPAPRAASRGFPGSGIHGTGTCSSSFSPGRTTRCRTRRAAPTTLSSLLTDGNTRHRQMPRVLYRPQRRRMALPVFDPEDDRSLRRPFPGRRHASCPVCWRCWRRSRISRELQLARAGPAVPRLQPADSGQAPGTHLPQAGRLLPQPSPSAGVSGVACLRCPRPRAQGRDRWHVITAGRRSRELPRIFCLAGCGGARNCS